MVSTPAPVPVTTPPAFTVAIAALLLVHVPPAEVSESVAVLPWHIVTPPPVMVPATAGLLTVNDEVAEEVPQLFVAV